MVQRKKLKWLIAHQPAYLFVRTAEAFNEELEKLLPGQFEIEALTMRSYIQKYGDIPEMKLKPAGVPGIESGDDTGLFDNVEWSEIPKKWHAVFQGMRDEKFHLSQTQITVIGGHLYNKFAVLDLPFLFDSHDHLATVLDGEIGEKLCEDLGRETGVKGLGFTYSGGYRIVGANHPINNIDELKFLDIVTTPMSAVFFSKFAKTARSRHSTAISDIANIAEQGGAVETTYLRFSGKHVLKTNHSMFLTTIMIAEEFFNTLTEEQQVAFKKAAKIVAKLERQWSIEDAETYERTAEEKGIEIRDTTPEEEQRMRQISPQQYAVAYESIPGSEALIKAIRGKK